MTEPKWPTYDPAKDGNVYRWVLAASQRQRERQPERIAEGIERIEARRKTHGDPARKA